MKVAERKGRGDQAVLDAARPRTAKHALLRPVLLQYAIARHGNNGLQLLHVSLGFGEEALVIFSSWKTARRYYLARRHFLDEVFSAEWYTRACSAGELVSLLLGPYKGIEWVLSDPHPGVRVAAGNSQANLIRREWFADRLLK